MARSTLLTVMERLRQKGHLTRHKVEGVDQYSSVVPASELLREVVGEFVQRTLSGSLSPFVTYLSEADDVSEEEPIALPLLPAPPPVAAEAVAAPSSSQAPLTVVSVAAPRSAVAAEATVPPTAPPAPPAPVAAVPRPPTPPA